MGRSGSWISKGQFDPPYKTPSGRPKLSPLILPHIPFGAPDVGSEFCDFELPDEITEPAGKGSGVFSGFVRSGEMLVESTHKAVDAMGGTPTPRSAPVAAAPPGR